MPIKYLRQLGSESEPIVGPTGPPGLNGPTGPVGANGANGSDATSLFLSAYFSGPLYIFNGITRQYVWKDATISTIILSAATAPIGSPIAIRVNRNGLPVIQYELPADSSYIRLTGSSNYFSVVPDDYLTLDVISTGSIYPGTDLTVQFIT